MADQKQEIALSDLFVDSETLPSPPVTVLEVIRRADEPDVQIEDLAKLIELDVALSVQLIRMANSSLYSPISEITSIERAISTLGLRSVRLLALTTSLRVLLPADGNAFDTSEIRRRMVVNGTMARAAAGLLERQIADEAFTCGLLGGLGRVVLATKAPALCRTMVAEFDAWPTVEGERAYLGFTCDEVTTNLIRSWGLPAALVDAIGTRSQEPAEDESNLEKALRLGVLAEEVLCGPEPGTSMKALLVQTEADLDFSEAETKDLLLSSEAAVDETADLLELRLPSMEAYSELLVEATARMQAMTLEAHATIVHGSREMQQLSMRNEQLMHEASIDALTGLANRGTFDRELARVFGSGLTRRSGDESVAILMVDLDHFKAVNDTYGHGIGDEVLRAAGAAIRKVTRDSDLPARYGGEEFVVLYPSVTTDQLHTIAERLRCAIGDLVIALPNAETLRVTASVGGAMLGEAADSEMGLELLRRADARLYEAKRAGRNQAVLA